MAELKTFDTAANYMKNKTHGSLSLTSGGSTEIHNVVAVTGDPNFFLYYEEGGAVCSPLYDQYISAVYIEGGFLKIQTEKAKTVTIHYGVYIDD